MPAINELDHTDAAVKWLLKGRAYTLGFEKYLPHTSEDLRNGKVTPEQIADELDLLYVEKKMNYMGMGGMGIDEDDVRDIGMCVANLAISEKHVRAAGLSMNDGTRTTNNLEEDCHEGPCDRELPLEQKTRHQFSLTFLSIYKSKYAEFPDMDFTLLVKKSTDETCEDWEDKLDKLLFRGKKQFLKKCPVYNIEPRRFDEYGGPMRTFRYIQKDHKLRRTVKRDEILIIAKNVIRGLYDIKKTCWQCKKKKEDGSLQVCGKCGVAGYCGRDCQSTSWKQGHKHACKSLKSKYDAFQKSLKAVDNAHEGSEDIPGLENCGDFTPNDGVDYDILRRTTLRRVRIDLDGNMLDVGKPSMQNFYNNLGRVVRGEWWLHPNADEAAYMEQIRSGKEEGELFRANCSVMTYGDESELNDGGASNFYETKNQATLPMPASRFLYLYGSNHESFGEADKKRWRKEMRNEAYHAFVEKFHLEKEPEVAINNRVLETLQKCEHGCDPLPKGSIYSRYVNALDGLLHQALIHLSRQNCNIKEDCSKKGYCFDSLMAFYAWKHATDQMDKTNEFRELWANQDEKALISGYLCFLGTEYLLKGRNAHTKQMATAYAFGAVNSLPCFNIFEHAQKGCAVYRTLLSDDHYTSQFFSQMINCSCLDRKCEK